MSENEFMTKNGAVEVGKTPSVESGRPSELIDDGEAFTHEDTCRKTVIKLARECRVIPPPDIANPNKKPR